MARLTQGPIGSRRSVSNPDSFTDLTRLLARLQQTILHADAERTRRLRTSEYERSKASINLEYARTLLTKLEQDALSIKIHTKRQEMQADLNTKRDLFEQITERLRDFEDTSIDSDQDDSDEGEDLLGYIVPTPSQSSGEHPQDDIGYDRRDEEEDEGESTILPEKPNPRPSSTTAESSSSSRRGPTADAAVSSQQPRSPEPNSTSTATNTAPILLTRRTSRAPVTVTDTATTTGASSNAAPPPTTTALRTQLFGNATTATSTTTTATTEAILDNQRAEQDKLTESMVSMARALKDSSHAFASALRRDHEVLENAGRGLERSERGLEGAAGRMLNLRRLTEGKGWWGRMLLYAWIAGLALFAVILVFVLPKLRF